MARSTINNRRFAMLDANTELRDLNQGAISATTSENALTFPINKFSDFKIVLIVQAYSGFVATTAQWDIAIQVSSTSSTTGFKTVATMTAPGTTLEAFLGFDGEFAEDILNNGQFTDVPYYIRAVATKTGSPGNLNYAAFLTLP